MQGASGAVAWSAHDLYTDAMGVLDRLGALPAVGPIGVEPLDGGSLAAGLCHDICRTIEILYAGSSHRDSQQQPERVHHDVAFPAFDFLASVESMTTALGSALRPMRVLHCWRSRSCICSKA